MSDDLQFAARRNPNEPEFLQTVTEVYDSIKVVLEAEPAYRKAKIFERLAEPERVVMFRVPWQDDSGEYQVNRGFRVQWSSAIGPYKGGCRFHPSVNMSIMKFLAFEQTLKNSLTTLPMGGGKGGADFDPKGKSDDEVMRFCQSFMGEMFRHIGPDTDIPAGDIGVGGREIGFMFGAYKKIKNEFSGVLTGKGLSYGGSRIRPEATGYGNVYFADEMAKTAGRSLAGAACLVSGSGNVAQFTLEKLLHLGAKPITASDSDGYAHAPEGLTSDMVEFIKDLKNNRRGRIKELAEAFRNVEYVAFGRNGSSGLQWNHRADCVFPSATQNEINEGDAETLVRRGVWLVSEGSNMSATLGGAAVFQKAKILYAPAKASNAGGVAVSGLEMCQNSMRHQWSAEEVDRRLKNIMVTIHKTCLETAARYNRPGDYVFGANAAGFVKVAQAMTAQGLV
ncbi:MAG: NADP-specific glutamate dehydrogenase [Candidatus Adiutrix sp.]|jgi:glutamate dehydrogenase (NADP+)|nr:NADP-specific glutamate dehydrogenase [Candidatus Adiutrix sp.]